MSVLAELFTLPPDEALHRATEVIPYAKFIGVEVQLTGGELTCVLPFQDKLVGNPMLPALHGGVVSAFLETSAILQLLAEIRSSDFPKPIDMNIDYLRSAKPETTYARAEITKQGRRVANVRATAWQTDPAKPVATLHGNFLLPQNDKAD